MPQACTICTHLKSRQIDQAIRRSFPNRRIASQFSVTERAIRNHKDTHIAERFERALAKLEEQRELDLKTELARCFHRVNKLFDACDRELTDPSDPDRYTLEPRAYEVVVVCETLKDGVRRHRRATLQEVFDEVRKKKRKEGVTVELVEAKRADPRKLISEVARTLDRHMHTLGELTGEFKQPQANPRDINTRAYNEFVDLFVKMWEAIDPNVQRRQVVEALAEMPETTGEFMPMVQQEMRWAN